MVFISMVPPSQLGLNIFSTISCYQDLLLKGMSLEEVKCKSLAVESWNLMKVLGNKMSDKMESYGDDFLKVPNFVINLF
mgnify:FL=1